MEKNRQKSANKKLSKPLVFKKTQNGAVLIVCLVMLTVLTVIAVSTVTDIGLQSNMAKNNQISLNAFNTSMRQLNAQYEQMKTTEDYSWLTYMIDTNPTKTLTTAELIPQTYPSALKTTVQMDFLDGFSMNIGGNKIESGAAGGNVFAFEFNSNSELESTAIQSDQTMGIVYIRPQ